MDEVSELRAENAALKAKLSALITAVQGEREIQRENFSTVSQRALTAEAQVRQLQANVQTAVNIAKQERARADSLANATASTSTNTNAMAGELARVRAAHQATISNAETERQALEQRLEAAERLAKTLEDHARAQERDLATSQREILRLTSDLEEERASIRQRDAVSARKIAQMELQIEALEHHLSDKERQKRDAEREAEKQVIHENLRANAPPLYSVEDQQYFDMFGTYPPTEPRGKDRAPALTPGKKPIAVEDKTGTGGGFMAQFDAFDEATIARTLAEAPKYRESIDLSDLLEDLAQVHPGN